MTGSKRIAIMVIVLYGYAVFAVAQVNPTVIPIVHIFAKFRAMLESAIFLLEQRQVILQAQVTYVTARPPASEILLEDGSSVIREVWLDQAGLTNARIDELLLALQ